MTEARRRLPDAAYRLGTGAAALVVMLLVVGITAVLVRGSRLSIARFGLSFWTGTNWDPVAGDFGALPFVWGTLFSSFLALLVATPLALGIAVFISELCPRSIKAPLVFVTELLAAIPSIVYGLWGIFVLVPLVRRFELHLPHALRGTPFFKGPPLGVGMLSAAALLAIMVIPFISSVAREVLRAVPRGQREAAMALGATRWEAIAVVLQAGRTGLLGAVTLGLGRALGETMAVAMVIGNNPQISLSLAAPQYTMASVLANEFTEAAGDLYLSALLEIGLLLLVVTLVVNALSRLLIWGSSGAPRTPVALPAGARPAESGA